MCGNQVSVLQTAVNAGIPAVVQALLKKGAQVDVEDKYGETALFKAVIGGN